MQIAILINSIIHLPFPTSFLYPLISLLINLFNLLLCNIKLLYKLIHLSYIINMNYITEEDDCMYIFNTNKMHSCLQFRYQPFEISQIPKPVFKDSSSSFAVLLGVKIIQQIPFLMIAGDTAPCCSFQGSNFMEVKSIGFIPIVRNQKRNQVIKKCEAKIEDYEKLFTQGHYYFSDTYKLHQPYLMNLKAVQKNVKFYDQFIFNSTIIFSHGSQVLSKWCQPIIQGYIDSFNVFLPNQQRISYVLISRRSCKKAGTRYYSRGIDDKGNVANFTQTQQIIEYKDYCVSHLQIRGSVPAFFQQLGISGLSGELNISRNQATTQNAFLSHFSKLHQIYGHSFCINLLSIKKPEEKKLTVFFESLINKYAPTYVRYQFFDFHEQCKNNKFQNADMLIGQIKSVIDCFDCNVVNTRTHQILRQQTGVMRTNCLDCLDRTNYVQSRISLHILQKIVNNFAHPELRQLIHKQRIFQNRQENSSDLLRNYNYVWAENGDSISLHYTGTGSTHTDITKNGKRTFTGTVHHKAKSLMRFFVQFTDTKKHEAINDMVSNPLTSSIAFSQSHNFQFINAVVMSFKIPKDSQIQSNHNYLFTQDYVVRKRPGIVVIFGFIDPQYGMFEFLKLNKKQNKDVNYFAEEKTYTIRRLGYQVISEIKNQSSCLIIFGNETAVPNVSQIKSESLGKNKDTLLISKFNIFHSSMVFSGVNCSKFSNFVQLLQKSHDEAFQVNRLGQAKSSSILSHNYRTVLGDIASGSNLGKQGMEQLKEQMKHIRNQRDEKNEIKLINKVLDNDELSQINGEKYKYMKNYMEGPTHFIPEANRIIFWNKEGLIVKVLEYKENTGQKCVYGYFSYELKKVN